MPLTAGTRLGAYEVVALAGSGGMGEVYRARDTRLQRDVALKILPDLFAADPERRARFDREAQVLASIDHPNIAAIHGLEDAAHDSGRLTRALVLEFVEGPTLDERIARGPLPVDEALTVARQIACALEAAHDQGIVHRDLKPSNVKLRPDGVVKILDFGLARALEPYPSDASSSHAATITSPAMTRAGVILGTAAYMSPEQARGRQADTRSDIWAFGCVLYEMLSGTRAFGTDDLADTMAAVLRSDPDWTVLPAGLPGAVRTLLRRCLQKDPAERLRAIGDARLEIDDALRGPVRDEVPPRREHRWRERLIWAALSLAAIAATAVLVRSGDSASPTTPREMRVEVTTPATTDPVSLALSPDGRHLVFVGSVDGRPQLWLRSLETGASRPLRGTEGASHPFWSPDSRSIGFFTGERLQRLDLESGASRAIAFAAVGAGGAWNAHGDILFTPVPDAPVGRIRADAAGPLQAWRPLPQSAEAPPAGQRFPQFLPDGRHFLYYVAESRAVFLGHIDQPERRRLTDADAAAVFAAPDELLLVRDGQLVAQPFDLERLELSGEARVLGDDIAVDPRGTAGLSASAVGSLAYRTGSASQPRRWTWVSRAGQELAEVGEPDTGYPINPSLSPDHRHVAYNRSTDGNTDIWVLDLSRAVSSRVTFDPRPEIVPLWSPGGERVAFAMITPRGMFGIHQAPVHRRGDPTLLFDAPDSLIPLDWSRDGALVLYRQRTAETGWDIFAHPLTAGGDPVPVARTDFEERTAQFSPDGRWVAYESDESGRFEIYVQSFPDGLSKTMASKGGGAQVRWREDGKEIFYIAPDGMMMAAPARLDRPDEPLGSPVPLFRTRVESTVQGGIAHTYVVWPDGQRFLMSTFTEQAGSPLTLILNRSGS